MCKPVYISTQLVISIHTIHSVGTHTHTHDSYLIVIVVHELHGRMHHKYCQITILLAHNPLSSSAYPMITHPPPVADNLPTKTLVARQLPTNTHTYSLTHIITETTGAGQDSRSLQYWVQEYQDRQLQETGCTGYGEPSLWALTYKYQGMDAYK